MSADAQTHLPYYGLLAEFESAEAVVRGAEKIYADGYRKIDGFSPIPVEGLDEALGLHKNRMPLIVLIGGIVGGVGGFAMEEIANVFQFPLDIGGRPFNSWPAFIPIAYELTILFAAIFGVVGMFILNGFPMPYHPCFNVPRFEAASRDGFFICIEAADEKFDLEKTKSFLRSIGAKGVFEVQP